MYTFPLKRFIFRKGRGTRDQIANICWVTEKARKFQENIYFCFIDYAKAFDCVDHNELWKILQEMGIPDHLTCLLRNLQVKKQQLEPDLEQQTGSILGKEYVKEYITLLNLCAEYIMWNAGVVEAQAGIKIGGRTINNFRYADDTTLMAKSEELKKLLMKMKEENEKTGLKLNIQKTNIMAFDPVTSWR